MFTVNSSVIHSKKSRPRIPGFRLRFPLAVFLAFLAGCSQAIKPSSPEDTPKNHYDAGLKIIGDADPAKPEAEFVRATQLDKKSPYGHAGLAALEFQKKNWKNAVKKADRALKRDPKFTDAAVVKARALIAWQRSGWFERTVNTLQRVLAYDAAEERALYYLGEGNLQAHRFAEAREYFEKAAAQKKTLEAQASARASLATRILAAVPVTETGRRIARTPSATRADVCYLLLEEMPLKDLLKSRRLTFFEAVYGEKDQEAPRDVELREDRRFILDILSLRLPNLDVFPNGEFYPDRPISRAQFAMTVQELLVVMYDDETLATRYADSDSPFPDVRPDYYAFNAIMTVVERGIMASAPGSGRFDTDGVVSGIDALEMIRVLEQVIAAN